MIYDCKVLELEQFDEYSGIFYIEGYKLYCFIAYCNIALKPLANYQVELDLYYFDTPKLTLSNKPEGFIRYNQNTFEYEVTGLLKNGKLLLPQIEFDCQDIIYEYPDFYEKKVSFTVNRIDISFI
ncbi:MAG: hypothetical protein IJ566_02470 [Cardiobacteriaceae bacterium]|nr:hypothetical protein [Cardiobacteriaceae bacterium]